MYYKITDDFYIIGIGFTQGKVSGAAEITVEEYNSILSAIRNKPADTDTEVYKLTDGLVYIAEEPEPVPEVDPFENADFMAGYEQALLDLMELEAEEIEEA